MNETYTLDDINAAFDNGIVDPGKILDSEQPLDTFYDQLDQDDGEYNQSDVADRYLPRTDELLD